MDSTLEVSTCNQSIVELSRDELIKEYNALKLKFETKQKENDAFQQKLHDLQREVTRMTQLEHHYVQEIETLQSVDPAEMQNMKKEMATLVENLSKAQKKHADQVATLEGVIADSNETIEKLTEELQEIKKSNLNTGGKSIELDALSTANASLKDEVEALNEVITELTEAIKKVQDQNAELTAKYEEVTHHYDEMKVLYQDKCDSLNEMKLVLETHQEEVAVLRTELESIKAAPQDGNSRGNSMFAEVDERRVELQRQVNSMKDTYLQMKNKYYCFKKQVDALQAKNNALKTQYDKELKELDEENSSLIRALNMRLQSLESLNERYKQMAMESRKVVNDDTPTSVFQDMIKRKVDDIQKLSQDLSMHSHAKFELERHLREEKQLRLAAERTVRDLQQQIAKIKFDIELSLELGCPKDLEQYVSKNISPPKNWKLPITQKKTAVAQSLVKQESKVAVVTEETENKDSKLGAPQIVEDSSNKQVQSGILTDHIDNMPTKVEKKRVCFSEDTVDKNEVNRRPVRNPSKVFKGKTVVLSFPISKQD